MIESAPSLTKPTPLARRGLVVAEHSIGARVGARVLARGGNAVNAAVATASTDGTVFFARPVAIRVGTRGLDAGLDVRGAAAAAGI
jgi:hypothetical protein